MNEATKYVRMHVINYEPTCQVLRAAAQAWEADQSGPIAPYRDDLADAVESNWDQMGLRPQDWDREDVDYAAIIQFEAGV